MLAVGARSAGDSSPLASAEQASVVWAVAITYVAGFLAMSSAWMQRLHWVERLAALFVAMAAAAHAALVFAAPTWPWRAAFAVASTAAALSVALLATGRPWRWLALGVLVGSTAGYAVETAGGGKLDIVGVGVKAVEAMGLVAVALSWLTPGRAAPPRSRCRTLRGRRRRSPPRPSLPPGPRPPGGTPNHR